MTHTAIKIHGLSVVLEKHFQALHDINVDIAAGKITGFIGPSGAGKTTLMRAIVGRQRLSQGTITIFDLPAGSAALRRQLSYMTQEVSVYPDLTLVENLQYFAAMFGVPRSLVNTQIVEILETIDMTDQADQLVSKLSGGQKQRVSLAISLIGHPKLMVLDEPTVGLDPVLREQLWALFHRLAEKGTTLVISSHVMEEAERCDFLLLLRDAELLAHGTPQELRARTQTRTVEQAFLKLVRSRE